MILSYGGYSFDFNSVELSGGQELVFNEGNLPYQLRKSLTARGYLSVAGQDDAAIKEAALRTALAVPWLPLTFKSDDGVVTPLSILPVDPLFGVSFSGVRVKHLRFPKTEGPEYATIRSFEAEFEAEYGVPNANALNPGQLVSFSETLSFEGGGPIYRHRLAIAGDNQKQLVYPQDTYRATQSGQAVGFLRFPIAPAPLWPDALKQAPRYTRTSPKREGLMFFRGYGLTWHYEFEDIAPLVGVPNLWTNVVAG